MHLTAQKRAAFDTVLPDPSLQLEVNWCTSGCLISGSIRNAAGVLLSANSAIKRFREALSDDPGWIWQTQADSCERIRAFRL
jgi:hypothetical protein